MHLKTKLALLLSSVSLLANTHSLQNNGIYSGCVDSYASSKWTVENDAEREYISIEN